jgi:PAS domain S-box-containing protein
MDTTLFFDAYFKNVEMNSILIMQCDGTMLSVNQAFTHNFGYTTEDVAGKNFSLLFNQSDQEAGVPQEELQMVRANLQANDENYVMDKNGAAIWCIGEAVLVDGIEGHKFIVKDIINLQSKRQLQLFLTETEEVLDRIFETSMGMPMMVLDGGMKILKVNSSFVQLFKLTKAPAAHSRLADMDHPFWSSNALRAELANILVTNQAIKNKRYLLQEDGETKTILVNTKIIAATKDKSRRIFVLINEPTL